MGNPRLIAFSCAPMGTGCGAIGSLAVCLISWGADYFVVASASAFPLVAIRGAVDNQSTAFPVALLAGASLEQASAFALVTRGGELRFVNGIVASTPNGHRLIPIVGAQNTEDAEAGERTAVSSTCSNAELRSPELAVSAAAMRSTTAAPLRAAHGGFVASASDVVERALRKQPGIQPGCFSLSAVPGLSSTLRSAIARVATAASVPVVAGRCATATGRTARPDAPLPSRLRGHRFVRMSRCGYACGNGAAFGRRGPSRPLKRLWYLACRQPRQP